MKTRAALWTLAPLMALALVACVNEECPEGDCQTLPGSSSSSSSSSSGGHECLAVACAPCPGGFQADADGCPSCNCLPVTCDDITDENACRTTPNCVPVYWTDGVSQDRYAENSQFQCCTQTASGVQCRGGTDDCLSDADCGRGEVCNLWSYCDCTCSNEGDQGLCATVCHGRCEPSQPTDCRTTGCDAGSACQEVWMDCACEAGAVACDCAASPLWECVPTDCRATGCGAGFTCQFDSASCPVPTTGAEQGGSAVAPMECTWSCLPDPCAAVDCGPGYLCQACGPNMDCLTQCVPTDCRVTGCGQGAECQEMFVDCGGAAPAQDGGQAHPVDCGTGSVFQCVPVDCRSTGCGDGMACQEVPTNCGGAMPAQEDGGVSNCMGGSAWICQPADGCAALTETECALDHDLCTPEYTNTCYACDSSGNCPGCVTEYVGCKGI